VVELALVLVVLFGSLVGIAIANVGWVWYRENPALVAFVWLGFVGIAVCPPGSRSGRSSTHS
jgi:hypothetical protein